MHKIMIFNENKENLFKKEVKNKIKKRNKIVKISDNLLEIGLWKGLIERENNRFIFLGSYEKFLDFKNEIINN
jgi:hypothetical protein